MNIDKKTKNKEGRIFSAKLRLDSQKSGREIIGAGRFFPQHPPRWLCGLMVFIFFFTTISPAWAMRKGNAGKLSSLEAFSLGALAGAVTDICIFINPVGGTVGSIAGSRMDSYMYYNHYDSYGETVASFDVFGHEIKITKGQVAAMVVGTVAGAGASYLSGAISGAISGAGSGATAGAGSGATAGLMAGLSTGAIGGIVRAIASVIKAIAEVIKTIVNMVKGVINWIAEKVKGVINWIVGKVKGAINWTKGTIEGLLNMLGDSIKGAVKSIGKAVKEKVKNAIKGIKAKIAQIRSGKLPASKYYRLGREGSPGKALIVLGEDLALSTVKLTASEAASTYAKEEWDWDRVSAAIFGSVVSSYAAAIAAPIIMGSSAWLFEDTLGLMQGLKHRDSLGGPLTEKQYQDSLTRAEGGNVTVETPDGGEVKLKDIQLETVDSDGTKRTVSGLEVSDVSTQAGTVNLEGKTVTVIEVKAGGKTYPAGADFSQEVLGKLAAHTQSLIQTQDLSDMTGGLWRSTDGTPISEILTKNQGKVSVMGVLSGIGASLGTVGWRPFTEAGIKILLLRLIKYDGYNGTDAERIYKNAVSMAFVNMASSLASEAWYSRKTEGVWSSRQEGMGYGKHLFGAAGREGARAASSILAAHLSKKYDLDPGFDGIVNLVASSIVNGTVGAIWRKPPGTDDSPYANYSKWYFWKSDEPMYRDVVTGKVMTEEEMNKRIEEGINPGDFKRVTRWSELGRFGKGIVEDMNNRIVIAALNSGVLPYNYSSPPSGFGLRHNQFDQWISEAEQAGKGASPMEIRGRAAGAALNREAEAHYVRTGEDLTRRYVLLPLAAWEKKKAEKQKEKLIKKLQKAEGRLAGLEAVKQEYKKETDPLSSPLEREGSPVFTGGKRRSERDLTYEEESAERARESIVKQVASSLEGLSEAENQIANLVFSVEATDEEIKQLKGEERLLRSSLQHVSFIPTSARLAQERRLNERKRKRLEKLVVAITDKNDQEYIQAVIKVLTGEYPNFKGASREELKEEIDRIVAGDNKILAGVNAEISSKEAEGDLYNSLPNLTIIQGRLEERIKGLEELESWLKPDSKSIEIKATIAQLVKENPNLKGLTGEKFRNEIERLAAGNNKILKGADVELSSRDEGGRSHELLTIIQKHLGEKTEELGKLGKAQEDQDRILARMWEDNPGLRQVDGDILRTAHKLGIITKSTKGLLPAELYELIKRVTPQVEHALGREIEKLDSSIANSKRAEGSLSSPLSWLPLVGALQQTAVLSNLARQQGRVVDLPDLIKGGIVEYRLIKDIVISDTILHELQELATNSKDEKEREVAEKLRKKLVGLKTNGGVGQELSPEEKSRIILSPAEKGILKGLVVSNKETPKDQNSALLAIDSGQLYGERSTYIPSVAEVAQTRETFGNPAIVGIGIGDVLGTRETTDVLIGYRGPEEVKILLADLFDEYEGEKLKEGEDADKIKTKAIKTIEKLFLDGEKFDSSTINDRDALAKFIVEARDKQIKNWREERLEGLPEEKRIKTEEAMKEISHISVEGEAQRKKVEDNLDRLAWQTTLYHPESELLSRTTVDAFGREKQTTYYGLDYKGGDKQPWESKQLDKTTDHYYGQFGYIGSATKDYSQIEVPAKWPTLSKTKIVKSEETKLVEKPGEKIVLELETGTEKTLVPAGREKAGEPWTIEGRSRDITQKKVKQEKMLVKEASSEWVPAKTEKVPVLVKLEGREKVSLRRKEQEDKKLSNLTKHDDTPDISDQRPGPGSGEFGGGGTSGGWEVEKDKKYDLYPSEHTVKEGDTLGDIAKKYYKDPKKAVEAISQVNKIKNRGHIEVGQELILPDNYYKPTSAVYGMAEEVVTPGHYETTPAVYENKPVTETTTIPGKSWEVKMSAPTIPTYTYIEGKEPLETDTYEHTPIVKEKTTIPATKEKVMVPQPFSTGPNTTYDFNIYNTGKGAFPYSGPSFNISASDINSGPYQQPGLYYSTNGRQIIRDSFDEFVKVIVKGGSSNYQGIKEESYQILNEKEDLLKTDYKNFLKERKNKLKTEKENLPDNKPSDDDLFQDWLNSNSEVLNKSYEYYAKQVDEKHPELEAYYSSDIPRVIDIRFSKYEKLQDKTHMLPQWQTESGYNADGSQRFHTNYVSTYDKGRIAKIIRKEAEEAEYEADRLTYDDLREKEIYQIEDTDKAVAKSRPDDLYYSAVSEYQTQVNPPLGWQKTVKSDGIGADIVPSLVVDDLEVNRVDFTLKEYNSSPPPTDHNRPAIIGPDEYDPMLDLRDDKGNPIKMEDLSPKIQEKLKKLLKEEPKTGLIPTNLPRLPGPGEYGSKLPGREEIISKFLDKMEPLFSDRKPSSQGKIFMDKERLREKDEPDFERKSIKTRSLLPTPQLPKFPGSYDGSMGVDALIPLTGGESILPSTSELEQLLLFEGMEDTKSTIESAKISPQTLYEIDKNNNKYK